MKNTDLFQRKNFNPRSREGSDKPCFGDFNRRIYFNPRSREGSDGNYNQKIPSQNISIHAPAKGATTGKTFLILRLLISIHAPAKGATQLIW